MMSGAHWVVSLLFSIYLSCLPLSLSPSHKSGSHTCVSLSLRLFLAVHSFCLPPLAFIRTVDGESRTDPPQKPRYGHMDRHKALPYVTVNTSTYATFTDCQGVGFWCVWYVLLCEKQNSPNNLMLVWFMLGKFFTGEVKGQVKVEVQGQLSRVGPLNPGFLVEWVSQFITPNCCHMQVLKGCVYVGHFPHSRLLCVINQLHSPSFCPKCFLRSPIWHQKQLKLLNMSSLNWAQPSRLKQ